MDLDELDKEQLQTKIDNYLKWGIILSIIWLAGIGSFISVINAIRSYRLIRKSNNELKGKGRVLWCFIVGGTGVLFWVLIISFAVINNL